VKTGYKACKTTGIIFGALIILAIPLLEIYPKNIIFEKGCMTMFIIILLYYL